MGPDCRHAALPARQAGYVLLSVTAALVVIAAISLMLNRNTAMTNELVAAGAERAQAQLAAESALTLMRRQINRANCNGYTGLTDYPFPPASGTLVSTTVSPAAGPAVDLSVTATTAAGSSHSIRRSSEPVYQWPLSSVAIAPDAVAGKDAMIADGFDDFLNFGAEQKINISNDLIQERALLQFDLSAVPADADIVKAILTLDMDDISSGSDITVTAHRITVAWLEGTGTGTLTDDGVDWHEYTDSDHWTTHGGDFDAAIAGSTRLPDPPFAYDKLELKITGLVRDWTAGTYPNYGLLLQGSAPLSQLKFYSSDHSNPSHWPALTVYWRCLCGATC